VGGIEDLGLANTGDQKEVLMAYLHEDLRRGRLEMHSVARGATHLITLAGELDAQGCPELDSELSRIESGDSERIVVDLSDLDFIDSTGIGLLVSAIRRSEQDSNRLRFVPSQSEDVQRLLELCGLDGHLPLEQDGRR
jgi:anti-sigma B factor antagonist